MLRSVTMKTLPAFLLLATSLTAHDLLYQVEIKFWIMIG